VSAAYPGARPGRIDHVLLSSLTTLRLGGPAVTVIEIEDAADVEGIVGPVASGAWPMILGGGSNVLAADEGSTTPVLLMRTRGATVLPAGDEAVVVRAEAGHSWQALVDEMVAEGLAGMESMSGIPGTVGAMPIQNVGAYGQETADTLVQVRAWDHSERRVVTLAAGECGFGHRISRFKRSRRWIILQVTFRLRRCDLGAPITHRPVAEVLDVPLGTRLPLAETVAGVHAVRASKGMLLYRAGVDSRSVGSVFLSPRIDPSTAARLRGRQAPVYDYPDGSTRVSASWLMREAGFALGQDLSGGVRMSTRHYTLVADDGATTATFVQAAADVQQQVAAATGVRLAPEPDPVGTLDDYERLVAAAT